MKGKAIVFFFFFKGNWYVIFKIRASQVALVVRNLPANAGDKRNIVPSLGQKDPLKKGMATHSSILAWRIPWTEELGRLQSIWLQRLGHDRSDLAHRHTFKIRFKYPNLEIPFLLCFLLLFFSQLFVRPPQTTILPFCISFPWGWSWSLSSVKAVYCHPAYLTYMQSTSWAYMQSTSWVHWAGRSTSWNQDCQEKYQ